MDKMDMLYSALLQYGMDNEFNFNGFNSLYVKEKFSEYNEENILEDLVLLYEKGKIDINFIRGGIGSKITGAMYNTIKIK